MASATLVALVAALIVVVERSTTDVVVRSAHADVPTDAEAQQQLDRLIADTAERQAAETARLAAERQKQAQIAQEALRRAQAAQQVSRGSQRSPRLSEAPSGPCTLPSNCPALKVCESRTGYGNKSNGRYRGQYQFAYGTWQSVGGTGDPADAPPAEQDARADALYRRSGAGQWPICGKHLR